MSTILTAYLASVACILIAISIYAILCRALWGAWKEIRTLKRKVRRLSQARDEHGRFVKRGAWAMASEYGHCHYCKRDLVAPERRANLSLTRDHTHPRSKGGRRTVKCCRKCNQLKADMTLPEWRKVMADHPKWWKVFRTTQDIRAAYRVDRWADFRPKAIVPFPFMVARAPLCRGLI